MSGSSDIIGWVKKDGSSSFEPEKDRYHLYSAYGCPFAHRATLALKLKGLDSAITVDYVDSVMKDTDIGMNFSETWPDTVNGKANLRDVYLLSHPEYAGKPTVPVLFDKKTKKIVSNSSADILRMLNSEFDAVGSPSKVLDLYPEHLRTEVDELNGWITPKIVFGVYRTGGAYREHKQEAYDQEIDSIFGAFDKVEEILSKKRYLTGDNLTEADVRLFVVLIRFDPIYFLLFRCCKRSLASYKNIWAYLRDMYQTFGLDSTINMKEMKTLYFKSKRLGFSVDDVIPAGPGLDYNEPHGRC